ncbi:MAG: hypothetical protein V3U33_09070, partial [candidate division NC10 bacterium]
MISLQDEANGPCYSLENGDRSLGFQAIALTTITIVNVVRVMAKRAPYPSAPIQEETLDLINESLGKLRGSGLPVAEEIQATLTSVLRDFVAEEDAFLGLLPLLESLLSETLRKEAERAGEG